MFIIFIKSIDEGIISDILKFADETKMFGKVGSSESRFKFKEDMKILCEWSNTWQIKLNTDKCKGVHIGAAFLEEEYFMENRKLENVIEENDLGVRISSNIKV